MQGDRGIGILLRNRVTEKIEELETYGGRLNYVCVNDLDADCDGGWVIGHQRCASGAVHQELR